MQKCFMKNTSMKTTKFVIFKKRGDTMEWVNFKVKDGERERIKKDAYRHEMNISEYLRWLVDKQRKEDEGK